jgi:hypothetical protein
MKKNKLYILIALLTTVIIFSVAVICNQCGAVTTETTAATTEKVGVGESIETAAEETTSETSAEETTSETTETSEKNTPTIKLEIYEGPTYNASDDICYYRIKATVTGNPAPTVSFSRDDASGAWGSKKVQINIHRSHTYKLTATATNSVGSASDSINLSWGCGAENRNPDISDIVVPDSLVISQQYDISATASDPDGDTLTYAWTVSGGSINNAAANPMKWTTPNTAGDYIIEVKVTDGKGGEATKSKTVSVSTPAILSTNVPIVISEGGWIEQNGQIHQSGQSFYVGDSILNKACRAYISFDITGLAGATINNATITFSIKQKWGDPTVLGPMWVGVVDWGATPIVLADFDLSGTGVQSFPTNGDGNFTCNAGALKTQLQNAITAGKTRFQIRLHMSFMVSNNNAWDGFEYNQSGGVNLNVDYTH